MTISALFISSHDADFESLCGIFQERNWTLQLAKTCRQGISALSQNVFPVILCESRLPDGNWRLVLECLHASPAQLIVCSRLAHEALWIEVVDAGGYDVIATPFEAGDVARSVRAAYLQSLIERAASRRAHFSASAK